MAGKIVVVGCRLPHGITLHHPMKPEQTVTLKGANRATIIGAEHGTTEVDADFWGVWESTHKEYAPLKSGAIFVAKSAADVEAAATERKGEKTGFERIDPKAAKKNGVEKADDK